MFDAYAFAKAAQSSCRERMREALEDLEDAPIQDVPALQGRIQGLRLAIREIQSLIDRLPNEDEP